MFTDSAVINAKQIKQLERDVRDTQSKLVATAGWRTIGRGYTLDEGNEAYRLANSDLNHTSAQLAEAQQRKITLDLTKRKPVDQLIDWFTNHV
jgi:transcription-repair coupling factor (superfamily II helicase)